MKFLLMMLLTGVTYASSMETLIEQTEPKVVKLGMVDEKGQRGGCSGAFIKPDGLVLTCAHCFEHKGVTKIFIKTSDEVAHRAYLVAIDTTTDLALVRPFNTVGPFPYFKFGKSPKRGQQVISFGSPLGLQHTVGIGWVVNLVKDQKIVFHSAFISPGNSGGPLVDLEGHLIGINEASIMYGFMQIAHGLYIAIDLDSITAFLRRS